MRIENPLGLTLLGLAVWVGCSSDGEKTPNPPATSSSSSSSSGAASSSSGASSSGATSSSSSSSSSGSSTGCGLALYPKDYDAKCQPAMDAACCTEEKACGASADCTKLIACINACPVPRKDDCVNACATNGEATPGYKEFLAIADCSKQPAYQEPPGVSCGYP